MDGAAHCGPILSTGPMRNLSHAFTENLISRQPHEMILWMRHSAFGRAERAVLSTLVEHPDGLTAEQLCNATGYEFSGGFRNTLSALRTAGVLVGKNTETMRAHPDLLA